MAEAEGSGESSGTTPLSDIFGSGSEPGDSPSADEKQSKAEDKDEGDQKFPAGDSSPDEKQDEKQEESEKPADDEKKEAKELPDEKSAEKKEEKPSQDDKSKWENEENPYFKRYRDTASNWNKEHQARLQLEGNLSQMQQEMVRLRKIADGTYDPETDDPARQITPEVVASKALEVGKALASRTAAVQQFGEAKVNADLDEFHQVFGNHSMIQHLVMNSEAPVYEAFRILDRFKFETKYGSTPSDIHKNISAEVEKAVSARLRKEITEELMGKADKQKNTPRGLSSSRGSNGLGSNANSKGKGPTPLGEIFSK